MSGAHNQNNLGGKVVARTISWQSMVTQAWGSEFHAPDHGIYEFSNGKKYDSTDQSQGGVYEPNFGINYLMRGNPRYPDMAPVDYVLQDNGSRIIIP